jgi:hypothetical protein
MVASATFTTAQRKRAEWLISAAVRATRMTILSKDGRRIQFLPNRTQRKILAAMLAQAAAGLPVRIIILKARQVGCSTLIAMLFYAIVSEIRNRAAFVCAHDDDSSQVLWGKVQVAHDSLPAGERKPTRYCTRKELTFKSPHFSQYKVQTAGKENLGRGATYQFVHKSEVPMWRTQAKTLTSLDQTVPTLAETVVVEESTAKGVGDAFHKNWLAAYDRYMADPSNLAGYIPIFVSWLDHEEYTMAVERGYVWGDLDGDEADLRTLGASWEQLRWRRWAIVNLCHGDVEEFKQEYPSTPDEAFRMSGRRAIPDLITRQHRRTAISGRRVRFKNNPKRKGVVECWPGSYSQHYWEIFKYPQPDHDYIVAGDVAEGELSDPADEKSPPDYHGGFVLDRVTLEQVAAWRGRATPTGRDVDADVFGAEMLKAARYYNNAYVSPEVNAAGIAAVLVIKRARYARLFLRHRPDEQVEDGSVPVYGWRTTAGNRDQMIDDWLAACRPDEAGDFAGQIVVRSARLAGEEESFIVRKSGKREHREGAHDDELFAGLIALQLHRLCPRTRPLRMTAEQRAMHDVRELVRDGARDPGIDEEHDESETAVEVMR